MSQQKPSRYIILDTCIIQHFANTELAICMLNILREVVSYGYGIAISDFTFFEMLNGATVAREIERLRVISGIKRYYVKKQVLIAAGHLGYLYQADGIQPSQIESGDKIIAATALLTGSVIYTTNIRDFPLPFFKELDRPKLEYSKNGRPVVPSSFFIEPDANHIVTKFDERMREIEKITPQT